MGDINPKEAGAPAEGTRDNAKQRNHRGNRKILVVVLVVVCTAIVLGLCSVWIALKASTINQELNAATRLAAPLKEQISSADHGSAARTVSQLQSHTAAARAAADDPLWSLASSLPGVGSNFTAVTEVARSADDVANLALAPLTRVLGSFDWDSLLPGGEGSDLSLLEEAAPRITSAAHAVRLSSERLNSIQTSELLPEVSKPLINSRKQLGEVTGALDAAADAANLLPEMLGSTAPRNYLLMIQNNAESRASGGIPGALAILSLDRGRLSLGVQSSATEIGAMSPIIPVDQEQSQVYSTRLGKFMQDVNLTPDFPTAATTAAKMWESKSGQRVDGVISIDPIVLGYILDATGPITLNQPELEAITNGGLPKELTGKNVVSTLLSDVYSKIEQPSRQDSYFAGVAKEIFTALSQGRGNGKGVIDGLTRGTQESRVLVWSAVVSEQSVINTYPLGGSVVGPSVRPAQFGIYFNDGTGAKMDYYVKRTVQLVKECPRDGYEETTVRITSTNTAPADAAVSLPAYVTGNGIFGVTPGSVQTNIVAYGPAQSNVETAKLDGQKTQFAPYLHSNRPVGVVAIVLAPGESRTVDFTFGKIVQHTEPNIVVTPTVQPVKDVTLPTEIAPCG